jgi:molybdopterin synthase catalytic subunit
MDVLRLIDVRDQTLSVDEVLAAVASPAAGGTALFVGTVRNHDDGRAVETLEYTAHPCARDILAQVGASVAAEHQVTALAAVHRVGELRIGDLAVVVAAASPHRAEAFAACHAFIDELKNRVPIWKRQVFAEGDHAWTGVDMPVARQSTNSH